MNSKNNDARVLIVESDDAMRVLLFTILRHQPLAVDTAINGESALEKLMSCDYALLLIDMDLPDDEARQFLRRFRHERPGDNWVIGPGGATGQRAQTPGLVIYLSGTTIPKQPAT